MLKTRHELHIRYEKSRKYIEFNEGVRKIFYINDTEMKTAGQRLES
jgi:hypothetical protein